MNHSGTIRLYVNPALRPGLEALRWALLDRHYSDHAAGRIVAHAAREGTPTGSPDLEPEDEGPATEAFVGALPSVRFDSAAWDDESVLFDAGMLAEGRHPWPIPAEPDGPFDRSVPADAVLVPPEFLELPPICGGSPDAGGPYEPTAEDLADYARWSAELDARRDAEEWYRRHPLSEFNAIRPD